MKSSEEPGSTSMVYLTLTPLLQFVIAGDAGKKTSCVIYELSNAVSEGL